MTIRRPLPLILLLLSIGLCCWSMMASAVDVKRGNCLLQGTASNPTISGTLTIEQVDEAGGGVAVHITGTIKNIPLAEAPLSQKHGLHIHQWGNIAADDGTGTGGHYNPHGKDHGLPPDPNRHVGDLGNIEADENGVSVVNITLTDDLVQLTGAQSVIGRAMILHELEDDGTKFGSRIAQCVIGMAEPGESEVNLAEAAVPEGDTRQAICEVRTSDGEVHGRVVFVQGADDKVRVIARVCGLEAKSKHGFHIHQYGDMTGETIVSNVGGHYNPLSKDHGIPPDPERHVGDMGNLVVGDDSIATYDEHLDLLALNGTNSIIGRAVMIHSGTDSGGQPTGGAGAKMATCAIGIIDDYKTLKNADPAIIDCPSPGPSPSPSPGTSTSTATHTSTSTLPSLAATAAAVMYFVAMLF